MAKHAIFLVHGMGDTKEGWSDEVQDLLKDRFQRFSEGRDFADNFEFVEVNYNHRFEERREAWKSKSQEITDVFVGNGLDGGAARELLKLSDAATGDDFLRTYVLDVVMYRFLPQVAEQVRRTVQDRILTRLRDNPHNIAPDWSIIAHSLGTSVAHDTLQAMFTHEVDGQLLHANFRPRNVFMIANVSRLLWHSGSVYDTSVKPNPSRDRGLCQRYHGFRHELDPFPMVRPFHEPSNDWLTPEVTNARVYRHVDVGARRVTDWNVHALTHYLRDPSVYIPILTGLLSFDDAVSQAEIDQAEDLWKSEGLEKTLVDRVKKEVGKSALADDADWTALIAKLAAFRQLVLSERGAGI